jgi:DNA mismatch repair ATPase MutS
MNIFFKSILLVFCMLACDSALAEISVIDATTKTDLELVNSSNYTHQGLAAKLDRTQTQCGAALLRELLAEPITDVAIITQRQQAIRAFVENKALRESVLSAIGHLKQYEEAFAFFDGNNTPEALTTVIERFQYSTPFLMSWNHSAGALDVRHVLQSFSPLITAVFEFAVLHFALEYLTGGHDDHGHPHHEHEHVCIHHAHAADDASFIIKTLVWLAKAGHIALHLVSIKDMAEFISAKMAVMDQLYQKVCLLHGIVNDSLFLQQKINRSPALAGFISTQTLVPLASLFSDDYFEVGSDEEVSSFDMSSLVGRTLVTYQAIKKNGAVLAELKKGIALLDVYSSLAQVMATEASEQLPFCFAEFVTADAPHVGMTKGWHPMLDVPVVVTNSFEATAEKYILTGPNWSGKSSFLRTLGINAALAQVFGIAAAEQFRLTLFDKILSFMTVVDDMAKNQSSFVARMIRADYCIDQQKALSAHKYALVLLDDSVGQGTSVERGEAVASEFIQQMGSFQNNIVLAATHLDSVKSLGRGKQANFKNIRMKIAYDTAGQPRGTYSLEPGISEAGEVGVLVDKR